MRELLSLDAARETPLLKGPYISLSRSFRQGAAIDDLISEGIFHAHMRQRVPSQITHVYGPPGACDPGHSRRPDDPRLDGNWVW